MEHVTSLEDLRSTRPACVTIGGFDGIHRGHQAIITNLVQRARAADRHAVVVTFFPHPLMVLRGPQPSFYLTMPDEKAELLAALSVDAVVTHPFNHEVASVRADEFVDRLVRHVHMAELWCGPDFALGHKREGTVEFLRAAGAERGFEVHVIEPIRLDGTIVSSTLVRQALHAGEVELAAEYLGRPFRLAGQVVQGAKRGRQLGIPTANLAVPEERATPAVGVYACQAVYSGGRAQAVVNIGFRPTFDGGEVRPVVEAHLLDFSGDLYDTELRLDFIARLRPEMKFSGIDALLTQIHSDIARARQILAPA
jgi:riboflavin kinase / FMN adenylyltransferase